MSSRSDNLLLARLTRQDEFYTSLEDIEQELPHYRGSFRGKVVFCNCDDPYESNFFKYFATHFNSLGLKKLVATCYDGSPAQYLLPFPGDEAPAVNRRACKAVITEVNGENSDVELLARNGKNTLSDLKGDGDFRSRECVELLKESDIVVTNPPFSLFREHLAQLVDYKKKFLVIGNKNAVACREMFSLVKDGLVWCGVTPMGKDMCFSVPEERRLELPRCGRERSYRIMGGEVFARAPAAWFTNLEHSHRHAPLRLCKRYSPEKYPKYDNYDAIEVCETRLIPEDYCGVMGVPITFIDKYCPEQFEILGASFFRHGALPCSPGSSAMPMVGGKSKYARIFIRRKTER